MGVLPDDHERGHERAGRGLGIDDVEVALDAVIARVRYVRTLTA